jgi:hypothetical protein
LNFYLESENVDREIQGVFTSDALDFIFTSDTVQNENPCPYHSALAECWLSGCKNSTMALLALK